VKRSILHLESNRYSEEALEKIRQAGDLIELGDINQAELVDAVSENDFDTIFAKLGLSIDEEVINKSRTLKYIVTPTTGLNHIDLEACKIKGITVISLKGETEFLNLIKSTAEHTWAILLSLIRKLHLAIEDVKTGNWQRGPFLSRELDQKTLGIIGYGRLGKIVARYAEAFDMNVLVNDTDENAVLGSKYHNSTLDTLLVSSDVISLHIPSNNSNYKFFNRTLIEKAKKGFILVNTSRGEVADEEALIKALQSGQISGAALDVLNGDSIWEEKTPGNHALISYANKNDNLIITPHMGGYAYESIIRTRDFITDKYLNKII